MTTRFSIPVLDFLEESINSTSLPLPLASDSEQFENETNDGIWRPQIMLLQTEARSEAGVLCNRSGRLGKPDPAYVELIRAALTAHKMKRVKLSQDLHSEMLCCLPRGGVASGRREAIGMLKYPFPWKPGVGRRHLSLTVWTEHP